MAEPPAKRQRTTPPASGSTVLLDAPTPSSPVQSLNQINPDHFVHSVSPATEHGVTGMVIAGSSSKDNDGVSSVGEENVGGNNWSRIPSPQSSMIGKKPIKISKLKPWKDIPGVRYWTKERKEACYLWSLPSEILDKILGEPTLGLRDHVSLCAASSLFRNCYRSPLPSPHSSDPSNPSRSKDSGKIWRALLITKAVLTLNSPKYNVEAQRDRNDYESDYRQEMMGRVNGGGLGIGSELNEKAQNEKEQRLTVAEANKIISRLWSNQPPFMIQLEEKTNKNNDDDLNNKGKGKEVGMAIDEGYGEATVIQGRGTGPGRLPSARSKKAKGIQVKVSPTTVTSGRTIRWITRPIDSLGNVLHDYRNVDSSIYDWNDSGGRSRKRKIVPDGFDVNNIGSLIDEKFHARAIVSCLDMRINKTEAKTTYKLSDAQLLHLPHAARRNPYDLKNKHPVQLFKTAQVEAFAFHQHGSYVGHLEHLATLSARAAKSHATRVKNGTLPQKKICGRGPKEFAWERLYRDSGYDYDPFELLGGLFGGGSYYHDMYDSDDEYSGYGSW